MENINSHFIDTVIDLGTVKEKTTSTINFQMKADAPVIHQLLPSCSCTTCVYNKLLKKVIVTYKAGRIPKHLIERGYVNSFKDILVVYEDGDSETLHLKIKISL